MAGCVEQLRGFAVGHAAVIDQPSGESLECRPAPDHCAVMAGNVGDGPKSVSMSGQRVGEPLLDPLALGLAASLTCSASSVSFPRCGSRGRDHRVVKVVTA